MEKKRFSRGGRSWLAVHFLFGCALLFVFSAAHADVRVNVQGLTEMVSVSVLVTDENGEAITDLVESDFTLIENGSEMGIIAFNPPASLGDLPMSVVFVVDYSYSLVLERATILAVEDAVIGFIENMKPEDRVMVVKFGKEIDVPGSFTRVGDFPPGGVEAEVRRDWDNDPMGSPIYDAIQIALDKLHRTTDLPEGPKAVIVLTDGHDTTSQNVTSADALFNLLGSSYPVYPVGFTGINKGDACNGSSSETCADINIPVMEGIAEASGTSYYHGEESAVLPQIHSEIHEQMANEYILRYASGVSLGSCDEIHLAVEAGEQSGSTVFRRCIPEVPTVGTDTRSRGSGGGALSPLGLLMGILGLAAWRGVRARLS